MTTYYLLATSVIFAVLFFIFLYKWSKLKSKHTILKNAILETLYKADNEFKSISSIHSKLNAHIRNQDAVMAQLTKENKGLKLDKNLISIEFCHKATLLAICEESLQNRDTTICKLEQANSIQAKAYQSLLNNNNKLHRELKLEQNNSNSWRASAIDWQSKYQELLREYGMDKLLPKNPISSLDLKELEANLDKALERDFPISDEYYDTITEINKGDVFLCVCNYGFVNSFNYYANEKYVSEKNQFITSHDGSPVKWDSESWQITANKHFKKLKPKK